MPKVFPRDWASNSDRDIDTKTTLIFSVSVLVKGPDRFRSVVMIPSFFALFGFDIFIRHLMCEVMVS